MQINIILQLFLIVAFLLIIVIISKTYFKLTGKPVLFRDSLYLASITTILLHIPLYMNLESRSFCLTNTILTFEIYLWAVLVLTFVFCIIIYTSKNKDIILEKLISSIFFLPTVDQCSYRVLEYIESGSSYTVHEIAQTIKLPKYKVFKALNLLVKENKARLAINSNAEFLYYIV